MFGGIERMQSFSEKSCIRWNARVERLLDSMSKECRGMMKITRGLNNGCHDNEQKKERRNRGVIVAAVRQEEEGVVLLDRNQ